MGPVFSTETLPNCTGGPCMSRAGKFGAKDLEAELDGAGCIYDRSILDAIPALEDQIRAIEGYTTIQETLKAMIEVEEWMNANYCSNNLTDNFLSNLAVLNPSLDLNVMNFRLTQDHFVNAMSRIPFGAEAGKKSNYLERDWIAQAWLRTATDVRTNDFSKDELFQRIVKMLRCIADEVLRELILVAEQQCKDHEMAVYNLQKTVFQKLARSHHENLKSPRRSPRRGPVRILRKATLLAHLEGTTESRRNLTASEENLLQSAENGAQLPYSEQHLDGGGSAISSSPLYPNSNTEGSSSSSSLQNSNASLSSFQNSSMDVPTVPGKRYSTSTLDGAGGSGFPDGLRTLSDYIEFDDFRRCVNGKTLKLLALLVLKKKEEKERFRYHLM